MPFNGYNLDYGPANQKEKKQLTQITREELEKIPEHKRIIACIRNVQLDDDITDAVRRACPMDRADSYIIEKTGQRSYSMLCGEQVFDDNFRGDVDRIKRANGIPRDCRVTTHGFGM